MFVERRKYTRYQVQANTYAAFGPLFTKVGKIKDISISGLAFEYINYPEDTSRHSFEVTIFLTRDEFFLWNLPCRLIYDISKNDFNPNPEISTFYTYRRCGLLFEAIREDRRQSLEFFLANHTRGSVSSSDYIRHNS